MAHRKHLSNESHVAPEHTKKASHEQNIKRNEYNKEAQKDVSNKTNKSNYGNSHIKDEHGEY